MIGNEEWLTVGKLVAPQGLHGEIRIKPSTDFPERFTKPGKRWIQKTNKNEPFEVKLLSGRKLPGKEIFIVQFAGIHSRADAETLIGTKLLVPSSHRPKLSENEFHLLDLVGLEVKLKDQETAIGIVTDLTTAGNDLLEVQLTAGAKVLIPFVEEIVPIIKLEDGWIVITPPLDFSNYEVVDKTIFLIDP